MEVLTAFVREHASARTLPPDNPAGEKETKESLHARMLPSDIQAILTVIGRRTRTFGNGEAQSLDLSDTSLLGANLERAQLQGAYLERAQLQGAYLERAQLQGADLTSVENLTQRQLNMACIDENTKLPGYLIRPTPCPAKPEGF
jgi:hypothetical protein